MKLTYAYPRKCPSTLLRFVLGTLLMKLAPGLLGFFCRGSPSDHFWETDRVPWRHYFWTYQGPVSLKHVRRVLSLKFKTKVVFNQTLEI